MSCNAVATFNFLGSDVRTAGLTTNVSIPVNISDTINLTNGTAALQFNILYDAPRTLSGTTDTINLTSVVDEWGSTDDCARIKGIAVVNTGADSIAVGGGTDPWNTLLSGTVTLPPGAFFCAATPDATGWAVTASTAMNLLVTGTSGQTYSIVLLGANA
jgi:hypothetical protein